MFNKVSKIQKKLKAAGYTEHSQTAHARLSVTVWRSERSGELVDVVMTLDAKKRLQSLTAHKQSMFATNTYIKHITLSEAGISL